jgi:nitroreductase
MTDLSWIMNRKSVRSFKPGAVSNEDLEKIIRAGMAAPSAVNQQLWEFIVVTDKEILTRLGNGLPYAKMLLHAPAAIIVCGDVTRSFDHDPKSEYWIMDCSAATENILLAVEALGLGAVWTAVYPDPKRVECVREVLRLPSTVLPLNVIPVGYPAVDEMPKDKWKPELVHWNKW